eukprot:CAMPEP_0182560042 /NCGR_PEP_ID=MMETSP1324-20130603/2920_1 /TAXON_ID=236786 /ORGANISM="Florenciella sp., Strain RCC1587" /LENGTH=216 /DNA_ID=CAMNT_0024772369 /DNA_START=33 /DNA_END=683 /DNA_ORIENTATION=-
MRSAFVFVCALSVVTGFAPVSRRHRVSHVSRRSEPTRGAPLSMNAKKCDCCGLDPIPHVYMACVNVPDVDICAKCATTPHQDFSAHGIEFSQMSWTIHSVAINDYDAYDPEPRAPGEQWDELDNESDDDAYRRINGIPQKTEGWGKKSLYAPTGDVANMSSEEFRKAMMDNVVKHQQARKAQGTIGGKVAADYLQNLNPDEDEEKIKSASWGKTKY